MSYFFTSESVSEGHPDKLADQISDSILDNFLAFDPKSKVACETLVTTGKSIIAGEVKSNVNIDVEKINILIAERLEAKKIKDFVRADQIRQDLLDMNIEIKDNKEGTEWSIKK